MKRQQNYSIFCTKNHLNILLGNPIGPSYWAILLGHLIVQYFYSTISFVYYLQKNPMTGFEPVPTESQSGMLAINTTLDIHEGIRTPTFCLKGKMSCH